VTAFLRALPAVESEPEWMVLGHPVRLPQQRGGWLGDAGEDLDEHRDRIGDRPAATGRHGDELIATLEQIALTGHGGGHFPAARKWQVALRAGGGGTVVANAAEGEPASGKDAVLVGRRPHLVLDGLVSAGEAVGAVDLVVWLHEGDCAGHRSISRALSERRAAGLREPSVRVEVGPASYLSGESSAVLRGLAGGPALPQFRRTPAARDGLRDRPALVHNVETLARVALAGRLGPAGYRPTTLLTVVGPEHRTVVEAEPDWTLAEAVVVGGGSSAPALLVGGYGGTWIGWPQAQTLADKYRAIPGKKATAVSAPGAKEALAEVKALQTDGIDKLHGKTVEVGVKANFSMGKGGANAFGFFTNAPGGKDGGPVTGGVPHKDSVLRTLMPREYIIREDGSNLGEAAAFYGKAPGMKNGGPVGLIPPPVPTRMDQASRAFLSTVGYKPPPMSPSAGGESLGGSGVARMMSIIRGAFPGLALLSGYRPGAITSTGGQSWHGKGRATDLPPRMDVFNWLLSHYGATSKEIIYSPAGGRQIKNGKSMFYQEPVRGDHWDHVHWAYDNGGMMMPGASGQNRGAKPERVMSGDQTSWFEAGVAAAGSGGGADMSGVAAALAEQTAILRALVPGFAGALNAQARTIQTRARSYA